MKLVEACEFDPIADVLQFSLAGIGEHSAFFYNDMYWLICEYTEEELVGIEILGAVEEIFGQNRPTRARVDRQQRSDGGIEWRFFFFEDPNVKVTEGISENGRWHAKAFWNDKSRLVSLIITHLAHDFAARCRVD